MSERIERSVNVEQSAVVSQAMNGHFENLLELGAETAQREACAGCIHLTLCGVAINALRARSASGRIGVTGQIDTHGVKISRKAADICPGELVEDALTRNQQDDFWLLKADELRDASLELRTAQTVYRAAKDVRRVIDSRIII